jgi:choline monooxygenase
MARATAQARGGGTRMTTIETPDLPSAESFLGTAITRSGVERQAPLKVPVSRYISPEFAAIEHAKVWPKAWIIACSVDHVSEPGDFFEFRLAGASVLIVRGQDGALRAFQNACRHRGNMLCTGSGSDLSELRCPYHRWTWDLAGRLREVPSRKGFGLLQNDDYPLLSVQVDTWGPFVFVNLDMGAEPLTDYLEGVPADISWLDLTTFRCTFTTITPIKANWKVVSEGFSETYHIQGIHRELLGCLDDINSGQKVWTRHGVSYQPYGVPSPRLGRNVADQVVWDSFIVTQGGRMGPDHIAGEPLPERPDGVLVRDLIADRVRAHQATQGADLSDYTTEQILDLSQYNLFPNTTVLVSGDLCTVLSSRPGVTPDDSYLVAMHFSPRATNQVERIRPMDVDVPLEQANFGQVLNQDFGVLATMQTGLHAPGLDHIVLSSEECRIITTQRTLSRYCEVPDISAD